MARKREVSERTVSRLIERGELTAVRVGRCVRIPANRFSNFWIRRSRREIIGLAWDRLCAWKHMPYKRKDSPQWWVSVTDTSGKRVRRSSGTTDRKEAQAFEAKWRAGYIPEGFMGC